VKLYVMTALIGLLACAACEAGTGGTLVDIEVTVESEPQPGLPLGTLDTNTGYRVVLSEAKLGVDAMLAYAPQGQAMTPHRLWLSKALAHGGFDPFNGRRVRAEYKAAGPTLIDLLAPGARALGTVQAEEGTLASATVVFASMVESRTAQAWVRGTATRDGLTIPFEGALTLEDEALLRRVDGIPASGELTAGGKLSFVVRPHVWFEDAHFDRLPENTNGPRPIGPTTQVHTAWSFGARSAKAYETRWSQR
jgi:hypothetical protein